MFFGRLFTLIFVFVFYANSMTSQIRLGYFQQDVSYKLEAAINGNSVEATSVIKYTNNSKTQLDTIYFHLWMNALSSKSSPFGKQILSANQRAFYFLSADKMGGYSSLYPIIDGKQVEMHFTDISKEIGYIVLPKPLSTAQSATIEIKYILKLPHLLTRMGYSDEVTNLIHWYPRVAVYDHNGWNTFPYLAWGEFYGEFSDFKVSLKHDSTSFVSAPFIVNKTNFKTTIDAQKVIDCPILIYPKKDKVTTKRDSFMGISITANYYYNDDNWKNAINITKDVIQFFTEEIGPFPYKEITISQGSSTLTSAMEYPGIIVINNIASERGLEYYIAHEIAHQYFYAALGFNERKESFMDEGLATFYEDKYTSYKFNNHYYNDISPNILKVPSDQLLLQKGYIHQCNRHLSQPINTKPENYTPINYGLNNYPRASYIFRLMEEYFGKEEFKSLMKKYLDSRINSHVNRQDFFGEFERMSKKSLEWTNTILNEESINLYFSVASPNQLKIHSDIGSAFPVEISFFNDFKIKDTVINLLGGVGLLNIDLSSSKNITIDPNKIYKEHNIKDNTFNRNHSVSVVPIIGLDNENVNELYFTPFVNFNTSDGWMPSLILYNSTFPSIKLKWFLQPAYSILNKELVGNAYLSYDIFKSKTSKNYFQPFIAYKRYSFFKSDNYNLGYDKFTLGINYNIYNATKKRSILSLKYDYIEEEFALFSQDGSNYEIKPTNFSNIRLNFNTVNKTPLAPSSFSTTLSYVPQFGIDNNNFLKLDAEITKKYYFQENKSFNIRVWASYFLLNTKRNSLSYNNIFVKGSTSLIYQAENDYAYDQYYLDRNQGSYNQTSATLGGGFKTPFNNRNLGQSNDLAFALNMSGDLPMKTSKYLPLSIFLDLGGYTTPSNNIQKINYLYSSGVSLSYFNAAVQLHLPLVNSTEINNIFKEEGNLLNRISISIDFLKIKPWYILDNLDFSF